MRHVCFFRVPSCPSPDDAIGGIERLMAFHSTELERAGWRASSVVLAPGPVAGKLSALLGGAASLSPSGVLRTVGRLRSVFSDLRPDAVVAEGKAEAFYAAAALRGRSSVLVVRRHHMRNLCGGWRGYRAKAGDAIGDRMVGAHLTISRQLAEALAQDGIEPSRIRIVPNCVPAGAETHCFTDSAERLPRSVALVGRMEDRKGHDILLRACRNLPDVQIRFVGAGERLISCRKLADRLGMSSRVTFHGELQNPWSVLADTEVVVAPSLAEGVPLVILEAFARQKLVIASDTGAVSELIENGQTGYLLPAGDEDLLRDKIARVLDAPSADMAPLRHKAHSRWLSAHTPEKSAEALRSAIGGFVQ